MELKQTHIQNMHTGDVQAFRALYDNFYVALCIFARGFGLERDETEDVVQEVFSRIYDDKHRFEDLSSLKTYLYASVRNRSLNHIRDEKRRKTRETAFVESQDERTFFDEMLENEVYRQMHALMAELPGQCRAIFERTLEGATSEQIARAMNLSVETVKTQRKKAKRILREHYALLYRVFGALF